MDKLSYALGIGIGSQLAGMGAQELNIDDFAQAIKDVISGSELKVDNAEAQTLVQNFFREQVTGGRLGGSGCSRQGRKGSRRGLPCRECQEGRSRHTAVGSAIPGSEGRERQETVGNRSGGMPL